MKKFWVRRILVKTLDLIDLNKGADSTDYNGTLTSIKRSIQIKGANIWILICGSLLASIGLDINSPTLLIGAMLISPLMVPILGIGVFYATRDSPNLKQSMEKMALAVFVSLLTSIIYFIITPFGELTPEISARTQPTLIDALIAFIGGVVGIISISRKEQITVLPGVAVAITLMPPICTVGYGISIFNSAIISGAIYLFLINAAIIIVVSSFAAKRLGFPLKQNVSRKRKKFHQRAAILGIIILLSPGTYLLTKTIEFSEKENKIEEFINNEIDPIAEVVKWEYYATDSIDEVKVFLMDDIISKDSIYCFNETFKELGFTETTLKIIQPKFSTKQEIAKIVDSLSSNINLKDTFPKDFARNITSVFPEVASVKKVWDDQQVHIQIEWAGPDIFINRKKQKLNLNFKLSK